MPDQGSAEFRALAVAVAACLVGVVCVAADAPWQTITATGTVGLVAITVALVLQHRRFKRMRCGALAPAEANLGMAVCVLAAGHLEDHEDHHGYRWPRGPFRRTDA